MKYWKVIRDVREDITPTENNPEQNRIFYLPQGGVVLGSEMICRPDYPKLPQIAGIAGIGTKTVHVTFLKGGGSRLGNGLPPRFPQITLDY